MKKLLLTFFFAGAMTLSYAQQAAENATGAYDNCGAITGWGSYINNGGGTVSAPTVVNGAIVTTSTNITGSAPIVAYLVLDNSIDLSTTTNRVVHVTLKSTVAFTPKMQINSGAGADAKLDWASLPILNIPGDDAYHTYTIDFSAIGLNAGADMTDVKEIDFLYFESTAVSPVLSIDKIDIGNPPTIEPETASSSLNFTTVSTTSFTINWTNGDGANRVVVLKSGAAVDGNPVDATTYTADAAFGSGTQIGTGNYVVYNGSGSSVTVTGLTAGTTYYAAVYELNGSAGSENYLTSPSLTGNQVTSTATGVMSSQEADKISLYPNPNNGSVQIDLSDIANISQIQILNDMGSLVKTLEVTNATGTVNVNTSDLTQGVYYLMIKKTDQSQLTKRMIRF